MAQFDVDKATMTALGDINGDGVLDTGDVAPFVQVLVGGNATVPEPGSLATPSSICGACTSATAATASGWSPSPAATPSWTSTRAFPWPSGVTAS